MGKKKKKKQKHSKQQTKNNNNIINLSICMIVRDEEKALPECLQSIRGLWDELIVVDTGSIDNTVKIARSFGAKVFHIKWIDDFSAARNESLRHATGKWIIWLDADDRLYPDQHKEIRQLAQQSTNQAFYFILQNDGIDQAKCYQLRMFPNRPDIRFERPIHEQVGTAVKKIGLPIQKTNVILVHTGYHSEEVVLAKKRRYLDMMKKWLDQHEDDHLIRYQYAWALHTTDQHKEAIKEFTQLLREFPDHQKQDPIYFYSWILLGRSYLNLGQLDEALQAFTEAEAINNNYPFLQISIAEVYTGKREYQKALQILQNTTDEPEESISSFPLDYSILKYGKIVLMGKALLELDQEQQSLSFIQQAIDYLPAKAESYKYLAEWYSKKGELQAAITAYRQAAEREPKNSYYPFQIGETWFQIGQLDRAKEYYQAALKKNPAQPAIWMNLAIVERNTGQYERALDYLHKVKTHFKQVKDINLQLAITYLDKGEIQPAEEMIELEAQNNLTTWMKHLLNLYNGFNQDVVSQHCSDLNTDNETGFYTKMLNQAEQAEQNKDYYLAETILKCVLFFEKESPNSILDRLIQIQIINKRFFQAIDTLENRIRFTTNQQETILTLENIAHCYKLMGVNEAYDMCRNKISELQLAL